jgi:tRNA(Glu) U13 pseudouridine synthase TruD
VFDKPLVAGITPTEVISMVESVREMLVRFFGLTIENMHQKTITSSLSKRLCPLVKTILSDHVKGNLNFHTLRSLYAEMAWYEQEGKHTYSKPAFYAQILGHKDTDITTALSYQKFEMKKDLLPEVEAEKKKEEKKKPNKRDKKVYFLGTNGRFFLERVHRGDRMKAIDEQTKILIKNGVKPTYYQLKRLGYGNKVIQTYKKKVAK